MEHGKLTIYAWRARIAGVELNSRSGEIGNYIFSMRPFSKEHTQYKKPCSTIQRNSCVTRSEWVIADDCRCGTFRLMRIASTREVATLLCACGFEGGGRDVISIFSFLGIKTNTLRSIPLRLSQNKAFGSAPLRRKGWKNVRSSP